MAMPVWKPTGSAMIQHLDALSDARIDIATKVRGAKSIQVLGGLQAWLSFEGSELIIKKAPILRKDTDFRVAFRATNADGTRDAFYTVTVNASKLSMLQSTLFFNPPINYDGDRVTVHGAETIVREMTDNSYETYASQTDVTINTADADGNPTRIDFIFLKTKNVDTYSFTPAGGSGAGWTNRAMPRRFVATGGEDISTLVNGFQHELYPLPAPVTATSVRMQFHGTGIEIYAVMLLEQMAEIRDGDFLEILPDKVDRTGSIIEFPDGRVDRENVIGAERWKWETTYVLKVLPSGTSFDAVSAFLRFMADTPRVVHAQEPARYPERVYPAEMVSLEVSEEYRIKRGYRTGGSLLRFRVAER